MGSGSSGLLDDVFEEACLPEDDSLDWRGYAAWGSFLCGGLSLLLTVAVHVYIEFGPTHPAYDRWEAGYFLLTASIAFLGVLFGAIGKDAPRVPGLVMSGGIFLLILGNAFAV